MLRHHPSCTADYPEKPHGEAPRMIQEVDGVRQCVDCGAVEKRGAMDTKTETLPAAYNLLRYVGPGRRSEDWQRRHLRGVREALGDHVDGFWPAIARGIHAWIDQAKYYRDRFEHGIGEDYVAAPLWYAMGESLRGMLNFDNMGPLDRGSLDAVIRETLLAEGWKEE